MRRPSRRVSSTATRLGSGPCAGWADDRRNRQQRRTTVALIPIQESAVPVPAVRRQAVGRGCEPPDSADERMRPTAHYDARARAELAGQTSWIDANAPRHSARPPPPCSLMTPPFSCPPKARSPKASSLTERPKAPLPSRPSETSATTSESVEGSARPGPLKGPGDRRPGRGRASAGRSPALGRHSENASRGGGSFSPRLAALPS